MKFVSALPAKSLVLSFFHAASDRSLDVATLVRATKILGLTSNSTRVALSRLLNERSVVRDERGRYRLGEERAASTAAIAPWRQSASVMREWKGAWVGLVTDKTVSESTGAAWKRLGFRKASEGLWIRPDNLLADVLGVRLRPSIGGAVRVSLRADDDAAALKKWCSLWDCAAISRSYARMLANVRRSTARLAKLSEEDALAENYDVAQSSIAAMEKDVLLPAELVDAETRKRLWVELDKYDQDARAQWMRCIPELQIKAPFEAPPLRRVSAG